MCFFNESSIHHSRNLFELFIFFQKVFMISFSVFPFSVLLFSYQEIGLASQHNFVSFIIICIYLFLYKQYIEVVCISKACKFQVRINCCCNISGLHCQLFATFKSGSHPSSLTGKTNGRMSGIRVSIVFLTFSILLFGKQLVRKTSRHRQNQQGFCMKT